MQSCGLTGCTSNHQASTLEPFLPANRLWRMAESNQTLLVKLKPETSLKPASETKQSLKFAENLHSAQDLTPIASADLAHKVLHPRFRL